MRRHPDASVAGLTIRQGLDDSEAKKAFISGDKREIKGEGRSGQDSIGGIPIKRNLPASQSDVMGERGFLGSHSCIGYPFREVARQTNLALVMQSQCLHGADGRD